MPIAALALVLAGQSISGDGGNLKRATAAAIVAGARACIGTTVDPAGIDARLAGWRDATGAQKAGMKTDGRVVVRDDVMMVLKPGLQGGCVVTARPMPGFDKAAFVAALGTAIGTPVATDPQNPVTMLPNGELVIVQAGDDGKDGGVVVVVANQNKIPKNAQGK